MTGCPALFRQVGREAAASTRDIRARLVIPCHYEMFKFNMATPDELVAECLRLGQQYRVLRAGERWSNAELAGKVKRRIIR